MHDIIDCAQKKKKKEKEKAKETKFFYMIASVFSRRCESYMIASVFFRRCESYMMSLSNQCD